MGAQWKHKGRTENATAKGRIFSKVVKEIMVAAKSGADPDRNPRLRVAVDLAKRASMPRETLERAIKKGAGLLDETVNYEVVTYEGFAPHQVPVIVECLTENKNRTATNIRTLFRKGQLATGGAVSWDFKRLGVIEAAPPPGGIDPETAAIEAGAEDLEPAEDGATRFLTDPTQLDAVNRALAQKGWAIHSSSLAWICRNPVELGGPAKAEVEGFLIALDEDDDVQHIFAGLKG